jgi:DNA polymerase-3 subunit delta'
MSLNDYPWLSAALKVLPARLPGALLIHGQRGTGKQYLARSLSQGLLCQNPQGAGFPCGRCEGCHLFEVGNHPDFRHLQPEKDLEDNPRNAPTREAATKKPSAIIGVDAVRELTGLNSIAAHRGGAKVIMISPAEALHPSAANALLKMLEEPTRDTYFILVTNELKRILPTIRSRCFQLHVNVPFAEMDASWLEDQDPQRARIALALSSNAPFAAREIAADEDYWAGREAVVNRLTDPASNPVEIAGIAESIEPLVLGRLLSMWVFDLLRLQQGGDVRYNRDMESELQRLAQRVNSAALCRWINDIQAFIRAADHPLNRRLALEALFAGWPGSNQRLMSVDG